MAAPDETTILNFRHLLETHDLCGEIFDEVNRHLVSNGIRISAGTRRRRNNHPRAQLDQECQQGARPADAPDQEGQSI